MGRISGLFGVKGWVKIFSYTQPKENILTYRPWYINGSERAVEAAQPHGKALVAKLAGCDDSETALALMDAEISIDHAQLPELPEDEYYWADLIGLEVRNRQDISLGRVANLLETGAHDVLVVQGEQGCLIPFVPEQFIDSVDLTARLIRVDWELDF